ncbi:DUF4352 domain-containing protein [Terribacillus sp. DMT04]|uniref:DUF4352 domain-containing protein n=1 Tax=Terribacillus sp. DMT04 TaxID=2850441 RepID=UPI001C2C8D91|nr:DUF4352 domain-containing protein [Terribacillus sp. DMT04]QXE01645.1 DUF4352 domain-containing protein [Terribacillus sp. DMT04]
MKLFRTPVAVLLFALTLVLSACSNDEEAAEKSTPTAEAAETNSAKTLPADLSKAVAADNPFFPDRLTRDAVAEKEILAEQSLDQSQTADNLEVTLEGIQYTKLTPASSYASSFTGFQDPNKIVAATAKLKVKNDSDQAIPLSELGAFLETSTYRILNHNILEADTGEIDPGKTSTKYIVFLMDQKDFKKEDTFSLRISSVLDDEEEDLLAADLTFDLPAN